MQSIRFYNSKTIPAISIDRKEMGYDNKRHVFAPSHWVCCHVMKTKGKQEKVVSIFYTS